MNTIRRTVLPLCFLSISALSLLQAAGCMNIEVSKVSPGSDGFKAADIEGKVPACLKSVRLFVRGKEIKNIDKSFVETSLSKLRETEIFSSVSHSTGEVQQPCVTMDLTIRRRPDTHRVKNLAKAIAVGATVFILDPFLLQHISHDSTWELSVERWDGTKKRYKAVCAADLYIDILGASVMARPAVDELFSTTLNKNITSLMSQLVADASWFAHSGTASQPKQ